MSRRVVLLGVTAVGAGAGYYLYQAGGDAKVAEKNFEYDASKLSSKVKSELPGAEKEFKKGAQSIGEQARALGDSADQRLSNAYASAKAEGKDLEQKARGVFSSAKAEGKELEQKARSFGNTVDDKALAYERDAEKRLSGAKQQTGNVLSNAVDSFDRTVSSGASSAQGFIGKWFGGGK